MKNALISLVAAATLLPLAAQAAHEPDYYTVDRDGRPLACYQTGPNEYQCEPDVRYAPPRYYPSYPAYYGPPVVGLQLDFGLHGGGHGHGHGGHH